MIIIIIKHTGTENQQYFWFARAQIIINPIVKAGRERKWGNSQAIACTICLVGKLMKFRIKFYKLLEFGEVFHISQCVYLH